jgi:hypothetical protein
MRGPRFVDLRVVAPELMEIATQRSDVPLGNRRVTS